MKAEELMIGDWIWDNEDMKPYRVTPLIILGVSENPYNEERAEPIPLTQEMFKRNGYAEPNENGFMWLKKWGYDVCYNTYGYFSVSVSNGKIRSRCTVWIDYVHELQHVLRLFGLNELADRFKVD